MLDSQEASPLESLIMPTAGTRSRVTPELQPADAWHRRSTVDDRPNQPNHLVENKGREMAIAAKPTPNNGIGFRTRPDHETSNLECSDPSVDMIDFVQHRLSTAWPASRLCKQMSPQQAPCRPNRICTLHMHACNTSRSDNVVARYEDLPTTSADKVPNGQQDVRGFGRLSRFVLHPRRSPSPELAETDADTQICNLSDPSRFRLSRSIFSAQ